ncbi:VWA domain-containing protein [Propioniciclava flava]|uniref:Mg-protoporphyrin IX chelatase n=1 Tax=Propioniciclava flava TaxID=2072026 RepID=A0A4Q2EGD5_9ACTN|nr:VWA domain-containing protein [Propioniciclava flava]RXW31394.1 magnesium chelatase [Propioniciclava flava]
MPQQYPFSAIVGCEADHLDPMGLALILSTISPEIGGVLIRGEKGTAKSTAVRALAAVLPPVDVYEGDRFSIDPDDPSAVSLDLPDRDAATRTSRPVRLVELPVGATEDRVLGSLQLESALSKGEVTFEPGLLARAHRGILYVDEVNLLHDHLVDLLLDAAAMGRATIERDGISVEHAARFVLIGTMNPEEGELRPQLLDRFGLTVEVVAPREPGRRVEVVRRRLAFDADPFTFAASFAADEAALRARIGQARARLAGVKLSDNALAAIARVCAGFEVDGLRADIVTARAAVAHAAWAGRDTVTRADIRQAALLALPHRRRRNPFDAPGLDEDLLDRLLGDEEPDPDDTPPEPPTDDPAPEDRPPEDSDSADQPDTDAPQPDTDTSQPDAPPPGPQDQAEAPLDVPPPLPPELGNDQPSGEGTDKIAAAAAPYRPRLFAVRGVGAGSAGRRSRALSTQGRRIGAEPATSGAGSLHLVETLMAAARHQTPHAGGRRRVQLRAEDLRVATREGREANLILFCVDASGSMAARKRMTAVKTAILSLLLDAYRRRDRVGLVTFRRTGADVALPPTGSIDIAAARLEELPAGGRTPLAEGLELAAKVILRERVRDPRTRPLLVVVTDGRANAGADAVARAERAASGIARLGVSTVVIDSEAGPLRLGLARRLASVLGAEHVAVDAVSAQALTGAVDAWRERPTLPAAENGAA